MNGRPHGDASRGGWARLWDDVAPEAPHPVGPGELGEFAVLARRQGVVAAARAFPHVAEHLGLPGMLDAEAPAAALFADPDALADHVTARCSTCGADLRELLAFADEEPARLPLPAGVVIAVAQPSTGPAAAAPPAPLLPGLSSLDRPAAATEVPAKRSGAGRAIVYIALGAAVLASAAALALGGSGLPQQRGDPRARAGTPDPQFYLPMGDPTAAAIAVTPLATRPTPAAAAGSPVPDAAPTPDTAAGQVVPEAAPTPAPPTAASPTPEIAGVPRVPAPVAAVPTPQPLPHAYVQNFDPQVHIYSGPYNATGDPVDFGVAAPQFTTFIVAGPQVAGRILVYNPVTRNYGWIDARGVGPSGPPR